MERVRRYWDNASQTDITFFGLELDEDGRAYDYEEVYSEEERAEIAAQQAREARINTPSHVLCELGIF